MIYDRVLRFGENVRAGNNGNKKRPCMIISHRVYFKLKGFLKLFTGDAGIRLHNISVFWGDHCVRLDNHRVTNHRSQTIGSRRRRRAELTGKNKSSRFLNFWLSCDVESTLRSDKIKFRPFFVYIFKVAPNKNKDGMQKPHRLILSLPLQLYTLSLHHKNPAHPQRKNKHIGRMWEQLLMTLRGCSHYYSCKGGSKQKPYKLKNP